MSYKALSASPSSNYPTTLSIANAIGAQLVAMGWSLYDDVSGSSYKIYRSNGESGTKSYLYLRVDWSNASYVLLYGGSYWNSTSHSSTVTFNSIGGGLYTNKALYVYGNKDFVFVIQESAGAIYTSCYIGHVVALPSGAFNTTTTATVTAGTNKVIPVTSVAGFVAGVYYMLFDPSSGYRQRVLCTAVGASDITVSSINTVSYNSGSIIGTHPAPVMLGGSTNMNVTISLNGIAVTSPSLASACTAIMDSTAVDSIYKAIGLPGIGSSVKVALYPPICIEYGGSPASYFHIGTMDDGNSLFFIIPKISSSVYLNHTAEAALFDAIYIGSNATGTTTGSNTLTTMADTSKSWTTDQWAGKVLVMTSGAEIGQIRKIISNTSTVLTIEPDFSVIPVSGSYVIANMGYRYMWDGTRGYLFREGY